MRFCLITTFFPPYHFGGDGIFVANLANALARDGHAVEVIHCADAFRLTQKRVQPSPIVLDPSIRVHTLHSPWGALSPLLTYATGLPLMKERRLREILDTGFDVIHWHNVSLVGGPGALAIGKGVKLCTLHEYWFTCPTHILFRDNQHACVQRACLSCQFAYRNPPQLWRYTSLAEHGRRHINRFLAPSQFVQNVFRNVPDGFETTILPHFVPASAENAPAERQDRSYYLFVGRLEKAKGLQTILPSFVRSGRRLVVAGAGNYESELRSLAAGAGNIEFQGRVAHSDLPDLYRGAIATVVPSICYETFGLVTVESLLQETPVISSDYGALPETILATGGGRTYRGRAEFEQALAELDTDPQLGRALGQHGRKNLQLYETRRHLDEYYRIIHEVQNS